MKKKAFKHSRNLRIIHCCFLKIGRSKTEQAVKAKQVLMMMMNHFKMIDLVENQFQDLASCHWIMKVHLESAKEADKNQIDII